MANTLKTSVCEFRATAGDNTNGGYFDTASGGTDYSNQDNPQLTLTDLTTDAVTGTTLSSATGGFTAAMVGNSIYISAGTGFTVGFYRVTAYTDTNNVTIDRGAGLSATGGSGKLGGALAVFTDAIFESYSVAGCIYHVKNDGTMTLTSAVDVALDGNITDGIIIIAGYNTVRGDCPTGTNRPLIACGANWLRFDNYWGVNCIRVTGSSNPLFRIDNYGIARNVKVETTSGTGGSSAIYSLAKYNVFIGVEGINGSGFGFNVSGTASFVNCYAHDSQTGIYASAGVLHGCVVDTCTTSGIDTASTGLGCAIYNNTIYNCKDGIYTRDTHSVFAFNNIIDNCTNGISSLSAGKGNSGMLDYNNYTNNTNDVVNFVKGANATALDPQFTDAANGDFSIGTNLKAGAFSGAFAEFTNHIDVGGVQREEAGGGGGSSETAYGYFK